MIHHDLCDGAGMRECENCVYYAEHYSIDVQMATRTRLFPILHAGHCVDWKSLPTRAADSTHDKL